MPSDRDREHIITSEGREVCRIYVTPSGPAWLAAKGMDGNAYARIDTPDGEAWERTGDDEEEAVVNLMAALADEITSINRLLGAIAAYRKGESDI